MKRPWEIGWVNVLATLRHGDLRATIKFTPKKGNGHRQTHPWRVSLERMRGAKVVGVYAPLARRFETEGAARHAAYNWIHRGGAR